MHVGPHKAASTYIQAFLSVHTDDLARYNVYWPYSVEENGTSVSTKGLSSFAHILISQQQDAPEFLFMKNFFQDSLRKSRNIILSAEALDMLSTSSVDILKTMLQGFDVTIVYVYRELLSHMLSHYLALNKFEHDIKFSSSIATYLTTAMDYISGILKPLPVLAVYEGAFGKNNLKIIDLIGSENNQIDIAYVVVCEIMGVGCSDKVLFAPVKLSANHGHSLVTSEAFSYYNVYVEKHSLESNAACRFCSNLLKAFKLFDAEYHKQRSAGTVLALPVLKSSLSMLIPYAENMDAELRTKYGDNMIHGNRTANLNYMRESIQVEALDFEKFLTDIYWERWMQKLYKEDLAKGSLCPCS